MKNVSLINFHVKLFYLSIMLIFFLISCNLGETPASGSNVPVMVSTSTPGIENLARGKNVTASAYTKNDLPRNMVDGNLETIWSSGTDPEQWVQINLGVVSSVTRIRLIVSQYPEGQTTHKIYAGTSTSDLKLVHEFNGGTSDGDILEFNASEPVQGVLFIRILTTRSPSWVAWREMEVWGYAGGDVPAVEVVSTESISNAADIIYFNGTILTMEKDLPTTEAIAIKGDTILAVGSEVDVMKSKGDATRLVDLKGMTLTPGFIDSHAHRIGDRWHFGDVSAEEMMTKALSQGWTSIQELFVFDQRLNELVNIDRAHAMPLRVSMYLTMNFEYERNDWWRSYQPLYQYSPYLQIAGIKITLDREWGEQVFFSQEQYTQMVLDGTRAGWQIATHSFSPKANQVVLTGYEAGLNGQTNDNLRLRLEHIGTMTDEELRKMAELGIIGSVGFINGGGLVEDASFKKYIPANEVQHTARWRDLINAGVFLIGNTDDPWCCTDWRNGFKGPVYEATVIQSIYQGVTRTTFSGKQPEAWQIAQAVTVQEALEMLTINGAYAAHQEDVIGSLKPGKYADLVILSANPLTMPVERIPDIYVVMTMVGGDEKYCKPDNQDVCGAIP